MPFILVAVLLLVLLPATARAERLPSRAFTTADGLSNNVVNRVVRDTRGYQWFCTREGLSMFDGNRFVTYGTEDGLPGGDVSDILETRDGVYWVATRLGLARFDPLGARGQGSRQPLFSIVEPAKSSAPLAVSALLEDVTGRVWVGTLGGLYRLEDKGREPVLVRVEPDMPVEVLSLAPHPEGALWVGTNVGLFLVYGDGRAERYTTREGLPGDFVTTLLSDDERLWVGTTRGGLAVMTSTAPRGKFAVLRTLTTADGLPSSWVNEIRKTSDGALWVATDGGLARLRPGAASCQKISCADWITAGLTSSPLSLAEDRSGNLWGRHQNGRCSRPHRGVRRILRQRGHSRCLVIDRNTRRCRRRDDGRCDTRRRSVVRRSAIPTDSPPRCCGRHQLGLEPGPAPRTGW